MRRPSWLTAAALSAAILASTGCASQGLVNVGYRRLHLDKPSEILRAPDGSLAVKVRGTYYDLDREVVRVTPDKYIVGSPKAVEHMVKRCLRSKKDDTLVTSYWDLLYTWTNMGFTARRDWKISPRRAGAEASLSKLPAVFREPGVLRVESDTIPVEYESAAHHVRFRETDIWSGYPGWAWVVQGVLQLPALAFDLVTAPVQVPYYGIRSLATDPGATRKPNPWRKIHEPFISPYNPPF